MANSMDETEVTGWVDWIYFAGLMMLIVGVLQIIFGLTALLNDGFYVAQHGRLLLLHGLRDDNVHVQNSVQLMQELQTAGKDFEVMFYPLARHGLAGKHYQKTWLDFVKKTMQVP